MNSNSTPLNLTHKFLTFFILILIIACLYVFFIWQPKTDNNRAEPLHAVGGDFILSTLSGPVSLNDYKGKVVLIYFGYTMCPDICPTNLAMMSNAFSQMDEKELNKVQGIFISVDPHRDTLQKLSEYTQYFHSSIKGMTGTPEALRELANRYGAAYEKVIHDSTGNYSVDHSSETYVIDPKGNLVETLPHAMPPAGILAAIRKYSINLY